MAKPKVTGNTIVYTASAWWSESDPSMGVIALTAAKAKANIEKQMKVEARRGWEDESYDTLREAQNAIRWSGVHTFALKDLVSARELDEAIDALESSGIWYPSMY